MSPRSSPTLAELRDRVHKDRHREIGNWLARRVGRPLAVYGTWAAVRLGWSAHQVTLAALVVGLGAALAIATGTPGGFVAGVALLHLAFWLDHVDGQVARWRGTASLDGVYLDYLMHHVTSAALGFALGHGLAARSGEPGWSLAGFAVALGWSGLSLHNDCRYKAFFQRLKRGATTWRIDSGSGGRPAPPARWPRRGWRAWTWPLYKACEGHVVLLGLSAVAPLAVLAPSLWEGIWRGSVGIMAVLAPALAAARVARAVRAGSTEQEFARWFQPLSPEPAAPRIDPSDRVP